MNISPVWPSGYFSALVSEIRGIAVVLTHPPPLPPPQSITLASAKAVAAGKSCKQADVAACANLGRKAVGELLRACKGGSLVAENDSDRDRSEFMSRHD